ncbi:MAG: lysophospholipid acyltransferase family protein [Planctomycetaceae bacterium]|jgi:KDO2-lipid IV(A) lauroyltransferase|nr:lysophospholipid acyltransferase family protein [Planctomycetaceae bacterium]
MKKQRRWFKAVIDYLIYLIVRVLFCTVQSLSLQTGHRFARAAAFVFTDIIPVRQKLLYQNLNIAFPDLSDTDRHRLIRAMWEHLFLMGVEVALARRHIRDVNWQEHINLIGAEPLLDLLNQDRPLIIVTGHFGNFEIGGFALGVLTYPSHTVARTLDNPYLNQFIKDFRESTGQYLIAKKGGAGDIIRVLENNGLIAFLTDQAASRKDCKVNFFGKPAQTFKAIAVTAIQFQTPIVVCYSLRRKDSSGRFMPMHFDVHINGVLDMKKLPADIQNVTDITQWYTQKLEEGIRRSPDQYWWIHNRWKR